MRILVIGPSWIGDAVMSHSMYRLLVIKYNLNVIIDVVAPSWTHAVIRRMPEINQIMFPPYMHGSVELKKCFNFGRVLRYEKKYHQAIILPNSFKSALIPFFANISIRTGWLGEMRYGLLNDYRILKKKLFPLMVQQYAALSYSYKTVRCFSDLPHPLPKPYLNIDQKEIDIVLRKFCLNNHKKLLIGICPGTEQRPLKNWPHYHYISLVIELIYHGYYVVILGSSKDKTIDYFFQQDNILKKLKQYYCNLIGKTSLDEAIVIIAACKGIVSNDSGLMHIACALQRPVVVLYGPSDPNFTPPLFSKSIIMCCGNNKKFHNINLSDHMTFGYHSSLMQIYPNQVFNALKNLLS